MTTLAPLTAATLSQLPGIRHGFFTRTGGISTGIYAGLNCGFGSHDDPSRVAQNRARVARHLGSDSGQILTVHQIHSATAVVVEGYVERANLPKADAAVTRTPGLVIGVLAADCGPVLFADPKARVVATAHAGWRGAVGGVLEATVAAMEGLGARRADIHAALGPCINQQAYEVGPEFEATVVAGNAAYARFFSAPTPGARPHFDLPAFIMEWLGQMGLAATERQAPCTFNNESEFFSFRRTTHRNEPDYGRQISAIVVD
jgi:polyphenol oxidase